MTISESIYRHSGSGRRRVLLVHGSLDAGEEWDQLITRLEDADAEFVSVDLAGMGNRADAPGPYTLDRFAQDVGAVIAASSKPVVVVGQSMGAQVAELSAVAQSAKVVGLVLVAPVPLAGTAMPPDRLAAFRTLAGNPEPQRVVRRQLGPHLNNEQVERLVEIGDLVKPEVGSILAEVWNRGHVDGAKPSQYQGPVLLVRGAEDPFVTQELVSTSVLPRFPKAQEKVVPESGHWPHVEQPEALSRILKKFLACLDQGAGDSGSNTAPSVKQSSPPE